MAEYGKSGKPGGIQPLTSSPLVGSSSTRSSSTRPTRPIKGEIDNRSNKRIISYDENGNPNCLCWNGNVYTGCGKIADVVIMLVIVNPI